MSARVFPIAHILSVTTGRLLCDIAHCYEILNFITGDDLFTHVLPRACKFAAPVILEQWPELAGAGMSRADKRLDDMIEEAKKNGSSVMDACGKWIDTLELLPAYELQSHEDSWMSLDPVAEAEGMVGKGKVICVDADDLTSVIEKVTSVMDESAALAKQEEQP